MRWYSGLALVLAACSGSQNEAIDDEAVDGSGQQVGAGGEPISGSGGSTAGSADPAAAGNSASGGTGGRATGGSAGVASPGRDAGGGAANTGGGAGARVDAAVDANRGPVVACPPGVSTAPIGEWVNVTPAGIPQNQCGPGSCISNGTEAFVINPKNTATLYLSSDKRGLFKTTDCGATWVHIDTGTNGAMIDTGGGWTMAIDAIDPEIVYVNSGYGANGLWQSTDGGVNFKQLFPPAIQQYVPYGGFIERIDLDRTNSRHVVVSFHAGCSGPWAPDCLAESMDRGATWNLLHFPPGNGEGSGQTIIDSKTWLYIDGAIWRTGDGGGTWSKVHAGGALDSFYQATNGKYYVAGGSGVLESSDTITWKLIPNSPNSIHIVGDGTTIFTSRKECNSNPCQPYGQAKESDPTTWTTYPAPPGLIRGGWLLHYDPDHHFLYSSNEFGGFWRVRTK